MPERVQGQQGRLVAVVAMVAVLVVSGCGSQSAEPQDKDWDEGSQSQQSDSNDKSDGNKKDSDQNNDGDEEIEVEADEGDPLRPDAAKAAEAEDFIADYLDAQNAATKDGDFSRVEPMIEECEVCSGSRSTIEEVYDRGGRVEGSLFTKPKISADSENDGELGVTVVSTVSAYKVFDASGTEVDGGPAAQETYQYWVAKRGGKWAITQGKFVK